MSFYLLLIQNRNSSEPKANILPSRNLTLREDQAREIFNNKDRKHIKSFGKFNPLEDLLIPIDYGSDIPGYLRAKAFEVEMLEEEDDNDSESDNESESESNEEENENVGRRVPPHTHRHSFSAIRYNEETGVLIKNCTYPLCSTSREVNETTSRPIRQYNRITNEDETISLIYI